MTDNNNENDAPVDDIWAAALAESAEITASRATEEATPAPSVFKPLEKPEQTMVEARTLDMLMDIPLTLTVELGRARVSIKQLLEMTQGSVVNLEEMAGEPMKIFINNHLVASGEVVVNDDKYGVRITEIVTPSERIKKLNGK